MHGQVVDARSGGGARAGGDASGHRLWVWFVGGVAVALRRWDCASAGWPGGGRARGARCPGGSRSGLRSHRRVRPTWSGRRSGDRRSGRIARRGGSARRVSSRLEPSREAGLRRVLAARAAARIDSGPRGPTGARSPLRPGLSGLLLLGDTGTLARVDVLAARMPGATGAATRTQRRNPGTVPGASKSSRSSHSARPPIPRQAEPSCANWPVGSLASAQRRTTAMSRSEARAYSALGRTQTVTDRGEVRSAASRFIIREPRAQATFSTRSTAPRLPRRASDSASRAKMTAPVSRPRASRVDGTRACLAWSTNAYWARKLT